MSCLIVCKGGEENIDTEHTKRKRKIDAVAEYIYIFFNYGFLTMELLIYLSSIVVILILLFSNIKNQTESSEKTALYVSLLASFITLFISSVFSRINERKIKNYNYNVKCSEIINILNDNAKILYDSITNNKNIKENIDKMIKVTSSCYDQLMLSVETRNLKQMKVENYLQRLSAYFIYCQKAIILKKFNNDEIRGEILKTLFLESYQTLIENKKEKICSIADIPPKLSAKIYTKKQESFDLGLVESNLTVFCLYDKKKKVFVTVRFKPCVFIEKHNMKIIF